MLTTCSHYTTISNILMKEQKSIKMREDLLVKVRAHHFFYLPILFSFTNLGVRVFSIRWDL